MKIVFYTKPHFLEQALPEIKSLSKLADIYFILEITPESWRTSIFDIEIQDLKEGLYPAQDLFTKFPDALKEYWEDCKSIQLLVFNNPRSLNPLNWKTSYKFLKYLNTIKPDIIQFDDVSLRIAPLFFRFKKYNPVYFIHDPVPHTGEKNFRTNLARKLSFRFTKHFILHSDYCNQLFKKKYGYKSNKLSTVKLGNVDCIKKWEESSIPKINTNILFFGRISPYKGLDIFLKAAELVSGKLSNISFTVAGKPISNYLIPTIPSLKNNCSFELILRYLNNREMISLLRNADIVCCPYLDATQSGVILNAYIFNKPVIVSNSGGLPEYVQDGKTGLILKNNNPEFLSEAIIKILGTDNKNYYFSNIAEYKKSVLNWEVISKEIISIYSDIISS
jgi:glycosyltransferase involved in cell wall biosynthesis